MPTTTKDKGILGSMEVETELSAPVRGRSVSPEVLAIRTELEKCLAEGTLRSFTNVEKDKREDFARKIRSAGSMNGKDEIVVSTRYIPSDSKLIWGPRSVMDQLSSKS